MDEYIEDEGDNTGQVTEDVAEDEGGQFVPPTETTEESADGDDPPQQVAEAAEGEQPYVMMEGGGEIPSGVVLVDENNQVVGGLPPGQQLVTTEDGQQVLISEDGTQQVISGVTTALTNTLTDAVAGAETEPGTEEQAAEGQQILVMPDGQQMIAAPGQQLMTEDGQLISAEGGAHIVTTETGEQILMAGDDAPQVSIADGTHSIVQDDTTNMDDQDDTDRPLAIDDSATNQSGDGILEGAESQDIAAAESEHVSATEETPMIKLDSGGGETMDGTGNLLAENTGVDNGEIFAPVDDGGVAVEDGQAAAGQQIITTDSGQQIIMQADGSMVTADGQQVVLQGPDGQSITPQEGQQLIIQTPSGQQQVIQSSNGSLVAPDGTVVAPGGTQILGGADAADGGQGILGEESEQVYQTADGQIISAAAAQQLMEGQQLLTEGGHQVLGHTVEGHPIIGQTETGQQIILQNGQPTIVTTEPEAAPVPQTIVAQMADGQPIYAYSGGDGSGLTPDGHQIIGQTGDGQIIAQLPDGQHIIIPGEQMLLAQQQQAAVQEAIKKEAEQNQGVLGEEMQQLVIQGANGPVITHVPKGADMGGTSILRQRDPNVQSDLNSQPLFRTVPAKQRTATSLSTPVGKMGEKSKMESLLNQQTIRPTSSSGGRHTIQIPLGGSGNQTIELPTSTGTKTIQLPMNRLMDMLKGSGGAGKTITLVKTPDGRTVTYVLSTPPGGQPGQNQPEKRRVGRPPGSVLNDQFDSDIAPPPIPSRVECEQDRLQRARELEERLRVVDEASKIRQAELDRWREQQDAEHLSQQQKLLEAENVGGRLMMNVETGELDVEAIPEDEPYADVPCVVDDLQQWYDMVPPLSDTEDYDDIGFSDVYSNAYSNLSGTPLHGGVVTPANRSGRGRGQRGRGRGRGQMKMLRVNGDRVLSMSGTPGSGKKVMALVTGEIGGKKVIAMRAAGASGENAVKKIIAAGGKGEGARMISVVKTKDGIIRKVLSGGNPNDMKKIIGQSVRVKTPQNNSSKMLQKFESSFKTEPVDDYDYTSPTRKSPTKKIVSVNNVLEQVSSGGRKSGSGARVITIKRVDDRRRLLAERRAREQQETLAERQRRQLKMDCKVTMEKIDSKVPISVNSIVRVKVSKVAANASLQRRNRGRPVGSGGRADNIRRPLWMKKLQALDSPMSRISARRIKKPSRFLEDSADSENDSDAVNVPRGTVLERGDMSDLGDDADFGADEFEDDDADFDINNDDYETPKKRGRPSTAESPAAKKLKTPASKIAISPENFSVCPQCKRVYAAQKHMIKHFQKEHPESTLPLG